MEYRLFIEGKEIEVNNETVISITKQFSSLNNPTNLFTEWTKTVRIPVTEYNDKTFGGIYSADKRIVWGGSKYIGLYFDPSKKLDFYIEYNNDRILSGYAKMNTVTKNNGYGYYEFTLFGALGKVFQDIKNITFDSSVLEDDDMSKYYIDGSQYVSGYINKDLVKGAWETPQSSLDIYSTNIYDFIGFGIKNSFNSDFDSKSVQLNKASNEDSIVTFESIISNTGDTSNHFPYNRFSADTILKEGLLPRAFGEYRSYYQPPYCYFNKLWQIFWKKAESLTGYDVIFDGSWFNATNPYYANLCYMLKPFEVNDGDSKVNKYYLNGETLSYPNTAGYTSAWSEFKSFDFTFDGSQSVEALPISDFGGTYDYFKLGQNYNVLFKDGVNFELAISDLVNREWINPDAGMMVTVNFCKDDIGTLYDYKTYLIANSGTTIPTSGFDGVYLLGNAQPLRRYYVGWNVNIPVNDLLTKYKGEKVRIVINYAWINPNPPFKNDGGSGNQDWWPRLDITLKSGQFSVDLSDKIKRSYSYFTFNDLWNMDYNLFEEILNYCKIFKLVFDVDDIKKKIYIKRSTTYFKDYKIEDWTNKVDYSKDFIITPISFENKYVLFNYKDTDVNRNKEYKKRYGVNYGEKKLNTDYAFNTDTKKLFDKDINLSINSSENILPWENIYGNGSLDYIFTNEVFIDTSNDKGENVDNFGAYYFYDGIYDFDSNIERLNTITDDTNYMQSNTVYCYNAIETDTQNRVKTDTYTCLNVLKDGFMSTFNLPNVNYTNGDNYDDAMCIYDLFWDEYLNEVYDTSNKKIECYIRILPKDFINFKFNKFIKIENNLYLVNKINDFDMESRDSVKCELVQIHNINAYTQDLFDIDYFGVEATHLFETGSESDYEYPRGLKVPFKTNLSTSDFSISIDYKDSYYGTLYCVDDHSELSISWTHVINETMEADIVITNNIDGRELCRLPITIQGD